MATAQVAAASAPDAAARAVLDQLHPLLLPAPPSWLPQTPAWGVLAVLVVLALAVLLWRGLRRWHANRHRRHALAELRRLRSELNAGTVPPARRLQAARQLPELVRRLALAHAPRNEVAPLQGEAGRHLSGWAYRPDAALPWDELDALLTLLERWIRHHRLAQERA
jgi:hypothetical protein